METRPKVFCKNCRRWYRRGIDQCEIPSCGLQYTRESYNSDEEYQKRMDYFRAVGITPKIDEKGIEFIKSHLGFIHFSQKERMIYGHPSQLNKNNDCYFYLPKKSRSSKGIIDIVKNIFCK